MIIKYNYPSGDQTNWLKRLDTASLLPVNQGSFRANAQDQVTQIWIPV